MNFNTIIHMKRCLLSDNYVGFTNYLIYPEVNTSFCCYFSATDYDFKM